MDTHPFSRRFFSRIEEYWVEFSVLHSRSPLANRSIDLSVDMTPFFFFFLISCFFLGRSFSPLKSPKHSPIFSSSTFMIFFFYMDTFDPVQFIWGQGTLEESSGFFSSLARSHTNLNNHFKGFLYHTQNLLIHMGLFLNP